MINGIILVNKPIDWTSFDVVNYVRKILTEAQKHQKLGVAPLDVVQGSKEKQAKRRYATESERQTLADAAIRQKKPASVSSSAGQQSQAMRKIRVGHSGTLDPKATGLLVLLVGDYTKKAANFVGLEKTYEAEVILGSSSTTDDQEGELKRISDKQPSLDEIKHALQTFVGEISQTPPQFSAIKIDGKRAYKSARAGQKIDIKPRKVTIYTISDIKYNYPKICFTTKVSSGTYIRSLARDIGEKLEIGAYLNALKRTQIGNFSLSESAEVKSLSVKNITNLVKILD